VNSWAGGRELGPAGDAPASGMRPLRILYHHRVRSRDGQTVHIDELVTALRRLGHAVEVVGPPGFAEAAFGDEPKLLIRLKQALPSAVYETLELLYNLPTYRRLRRAHRAFRPDVIYERCNLYLLAGALLRRRTRTPLLLEVNAPLAEERARFGGLGLLGLAERLERRVWRSADCVLPVTEVLAERLRRAGVPAGRIAVTPNGIDPERFLADVGERDRCKAELGLAGKVVLGFTGFMREWHGLDAAIDFLASPAAAAHIHLVLVGDGPARPGLERQVARLGLVERVRFTGVVERDAVARFIASFDIALQPRAVAYASPLKLFEYMAAGDAIVAPDQPNIREVLTHDASALLFDPARAGAMVEAILRLVREPELRRRLGLAAQAAILERGFTWRHNAERVAALTARLVSSRAIA
jgi:glycosyltransferase involved in cell wall biosynthesis